MISLDFLKALLVPRCLISLIKRKLNIRTPYGTSFSVITAKTPFLSSPLISLRYKSIKGVSCTRTNISTGGDYLADIPAEVR
jgi:hypothetical protein